MIFISIKCKGQGNYGNFKLKARIYLPAIEELAEFEKDMLDDKDKFRKIKNHFKKQSSTELKKKKLKQNTKNS